ncbi:hypothetical protein ACVXZ4_08310 [Lacisediminihabitans sp. FW035]
MPTKRTIKTRVDGLKQAYHTGRTPVEPREAVTKPPVAAVAPLAPAPVSKRKVQPLAPALQDLLAARGIDPKTLRLRGERPNPDDEFNELTIFIEGYRDDEVDDDGELILDEAFYSARLTVGEKSIFEGELATDDGRAWPDEDLEGPEKASNRALAEFGIQLHTDGDNFCGDDGQGTFAFVYNVRRTEAPAD